MTQPSLPSLTSAQLIAAGLLATNYPADTRWHASFFAEEGDPDLYLQDLDRDRMFRLTADGLLQEMAE